MNKEVIKLSKKELAQYLNVNLRGLESIERTGNLTRRLNEASYRLIQKHKTGRNNYYIVENFNILDMNVSFEEFCNYCKIKDIDDFKKYIKEMAACLMEENDMLSTNEFKNKLEKTFYTIKKYSEVLLNNNILSELGYIYYKTSENGKCYYISEDEYNKDCFKGKGTRKIFRDKDICGNKDLLDSIVSVIRNEFAQYIIPCVKKEKCEECGSIEGLSVHHSYPFMNQLNDAFEELGLKNKTELSEREIKNLKIYMLGSQMKFKSITLCHRCHVEHHNQYIYSGKVYNYKKVKNYTKGSNFDRFFNMIR